MPIGSIYISVNSTNPANYFGGTWEQIKDRFLLACGNSYGNGTTGGEASHTLTGNEIPSHSHSFTTNGAGGHNHSGLYWTGSTPIALSGYNATTSGYRTGYSSGSVNPGYMVTGWAGDHSHSGTTSSYGSTWGHNNMPPYLAVYVWKRVS